MKELLKNIELELEMYFDKKIKEAKVSDELFNEVWDLVGNLEEDIEEFIEHTDKTMDTIMEEATAEYNPSFFEEMHADSRARQDALYSIDNNYYLTR